MSPGAQFLRADLHIHSYGVSADVRDSKMTVDEIVRTAQERELDVIAIADHNAIDNVEELLGAVSTPGLTAFAAVEVTTAEGHVLVYFNPEQYEAFSQWFGRVEFKEDASGDRHTLTPIHQLLEQVAQAGGIGIPAHIGREGTGFLTRVQAQSEDAVITSAHLRAVEVDDASQGAWYSPADVGEGSSRRRELLGRRENVLGSVAGPRLAKLLFSDAHSLDAIGRDRDGQDRVTRSVSGRGRGFGSSGLE